MFNLNDTYSIYMTIGSISLLLLLLAFGLSLSLCLRRMHGVQRQQASNFKNMMNACRYLLVLNRKLNALEQHIQPATDTTLREPNRLFRSDSAYQYAAELLGNGVSIHEVVESTGLSFGEAELIQSLQQ